MPSLPERFRGGARTAGGILGYPPDQLRREVALIACHFHWSYEEIMYMEHQERHEWVQEIVRLTRGENKLSLPKNQGSTY
ncbi:DUF6760 family protein [Methanosarcina sp.]|uniref:DUF6760 family protein n=1 Tax=Methanosarcina sp. TaxID=2213 RepID=UPI002988EA08|nr:DUF6760 family protein [Methanosarcina sp.]MDW5549445.1 DUF6760 family protein [Methanosarcina sp.]MDW5553364.1 DUF6760 family protein [Methanosarcina sp.]MDW5559688.1 DUF6760 family protein [Methanosarcina sp.]